MGENIKRDVPETWWEGVEWIKLAHDRNRRWDPVNTVINLWAPWNVDNFWTATGTDTSHFPSTYKQYFADNRTISKQKKMNSKFRPCTVLTGKNYRPITTVSHEWIWTSYLSIYCCLDCREITTLHRTPKFITVATKACNWTVARAKRIKSTETSTKFNFNIILFSTLSLS